MVDMESRATFIEKEIAFARITGDELFKGYSGGVQVESWTETEHQGGERIAAKFTALIDDERVALFMEYENYPASTFDPPFSECTFMEA